LAQAYPGSTDSVVVLCFLSEDLKMPKATSKQADRRNNKKSSQEEEETTSAGSPGNFVELAKQLAMKSCLAEAVPKVSVFVQTIKDGKFEELLKEQPATNVIKKDEAENSENKENETENSENKENQDVQENGKVDCKNMFSTLNSRLTWYNVLGLGMPASGEEAMKAWKDMIGLEVDFGPKKKKGSPGVDRILKNVHNLLPQYMHLLLALMMLRAFLFRSWFACLPWSVGYQILSLFVPLEGFPDKLPQVPVEKCPSFVRVMIALVLHAFVWLFFIYEFVLCTYFFEKIPLVGLFAYHAYAVRPLEQ